MAFAVDALCAVEHALCVSLFHFFFGRWRYCARRIFNYYSLRAVEKNTWVQAAFAMASNCTLKEPNTFCYSFFTLFLSACADFGLSIGLIYTNWPVLLLGSETEGVLFTAIAQEFLPTSAGCNEDAQILLSR